jgi:pteridine reductase
MELAGKIALVTGAAHRVGKAIALGLAREGVHLIVHYGGSAGAAEATAVEIRALGMQAITAQADLANPTQITALFRQVESHFGRLDLLVNSAASFHRDAFMNISADEWDAVMAVNLRAPFLCMQHAARLMGSQGGVIINISDLAGVYAWRDFTAHGVSKAGLNHLTKQAARELAPHIRVNTIVPGPILAAPGMSEAAWEAIADHVPLKRTGTPEDITKAVIYLAQSDYITGESITVDGGEALDGPAWH